MTNERELPMEDDDGDDEVLCPWCGLEHDPQDIRFPKRHDTAQHECNCGKLFSVTRTVLVAYSTEKLEE